MTATGHVESAAASVSRIARKAQRLHDDRRYAEIPSARAFRVVGDNGTYTVTLNATGEGAWCTCPAYGTCSHIGAALLAAGLVG